MTDLPQTPSTEAGKALLNSWKQDAEYEDDNADFIIQIEAEARATNECHITALRSVLDDVGRWIAASDGPQSIIDDIERASRDTEGTATEERERIEKPWREALAKHQRVVTAHIRDHPMRAPDCATCDELARIGIETLEAIDKARHSLLNSDTEGRSSAVEVTTNPDKCPETGQAHRWGYFTGIHGQQTTTEHCFDCRANRADTEGQLEEGGR